MNGTLEEKYIPLSEVGAGASGVIRLVECKKDGKKYVVKEVEMKDFNKKDVQHAMSEVSVLASFKHPHIVEHKESFVDGSILYIVMEYADGGDMEQVIKAQRKLGRYFDEDKLLLWFTQICLALKHVHDRKVLHRDLKTQNVFLTSDGTIKLGDFGLTVVLKDTVDMAETRLGTPYYMSPELCQGVPYTAKNDIWALGCIFYKMCALRHAYLGKSLNELVKIILTEPPPKLPRGFSKKTQKIINALLEKNPLDRPSINQLLRVSFLQQITRQTLAQDVFEDEFSHTTLHSLPMPGGADVSSGSGSISSGSGENSDKEESERAFTILAQKYAALDTEESSSSEPAKTVNGVQDLRQRYLAAQKAKRTAAA